MRGVPSETQHTVRRSTIYCRPKAGNDTDCAIMLHIILQDKKRIMMISGYIIDIRYTRILLYDIYRVLDSYLTYIGLFLNCYLIRFLFEDWAQRCPEVGFQARCNSAKVSTRCSCAAFAQTMMFVSIGAIGDCRFSDT